VTEIPLPADVTTAINGYAGGTYPSPRRMGQFDRLTIGSFEVIPEDQLVTQRYFGMRHTDTFVDALLTSTSGQFYLISNAVRSDAGGSLAAVPWLGALKATPDGMVPDPRYVAWAGGAVQALSPDGQVVYSLPDNASPEQLAFDAASLAWSSETGDIRLVGERAGSGTQWLLGWRQPDGPTGEMLYNQQGYHVTGNYHGEAVSGHVVLETMWGNESYGSTWWLPNRIGHWAFFVNTYTDGSSEYGQVLCGEYGARGAVIVDGQGDELVCTTNVNVSQEAEDRLVYAFGNGERWEFTSEPTRGFPPFGSTRLSVGSARRIGDERELEAGNGTHFIAERLLDHRPFQ
jgi:hypothetical protein